MNSETHIRILVLKKRDLAYSLDDTGKHIGVWNCSKGVFQSLRRVPVAEHAHNREEIKIIPSPKHNGLGSTSKLLNKPVHGLFQLPKQKVRFLLRESLIYS